MNQKTNLKIGTKVKFYHMRTKRMRTRYIASKMSRGRYGMTILKGGSANEIIHWSDIEEYKQP